MEPHLYDIIVVGTGPGGCMAAARLAKKGLDVLVLEKFSLPRYKTCGGGVTKRALMKMPIDITSVIRDRIDTFESIYNGGKPMVIRRKSPFVYTVMRDELDYLLAQYAVSCGAQLKSETFVTHVEEQDDKVILYTRKELFTARYVIAADGVNSLIAKKLGLMQERKKALAFECEIEYEPHVLQRYKHTIAIDYGNVADGYTWIFPKQSHLSIGIGSYSISLVEMNQILKNFIKNYGLIGRVNSAKGFFLSVGGIQQQVITKRVALIGDAAGLVDSFAGEGIYYALWSAELASDRLIETLTHNKTAFLDYQTDIDTLILPELQMLHQVGLSFYKNIQTVNKIVARFPQIMNVVFDLIEGKCSYMKLYQIYRKFSVST